jgi:hypothetical protein
MSWARLSLLTNVTREPAATVTSRGDTPLEVIVIVALVGAGVGVDVGVGVGVGDGEAGVELLSPPPHAAATTMNAMATGARRVLKDMFRYLTNR